MVLLRVCILFKRKDLKKNAFLISFPGLYRGVGIYKAEISERISKRRLKKCIKKLSELKLSFVALSPDFCLSDTFLCFGITPIYGINLLLRHSADAALCLAESLKLPTTFYICGGSFWSVTRAALTLLAKTNNVFVSCADSCAVAEACLNACGAVIKSSPPQEHIRISLSDDGFELFSRDKNFSFSAFKIPLPADFPFDIPDTCHTSLCEALDLCGILKDSDVKIIFSET